MSLFQDPLFPVSLTANISISETHDLVRLEQCLDWDQLILLVMEIRSRRVKRDTGRKTHFRALIGATVLMALRSITFRQAEDQIANYAPARYLCGLMESDWSPDHVTIFEFTQMLGSDGMDELNQRVLHLAKESGFVDSTEVMSDTTAQEAMIPYPNEVGLMGRFTDLAGRWIGKLGGKFQELKTQVKSKVQEVKGLVRNSHLFAKTVEQKKKVTEKLYHVTKEFHAQIEELLASGGRLRTKSGKDLAKLTHTMGILLPQILHFLETGLVAKGKVIHLQMEKLYAIVRGKAGRSVEFGLKWGINRISGGFIQGFLMNNLSNASDKQFCIEAVKIHTATFGEAPQVYGFDRGGYSRSNIKNLSNLGVGEVGVAPLGKDDWHVSDKWKEHIKRERAQVEGVIGTIKHKRYGFNKPNARSTSAMVSYGHRAILGFNLNKLVKMASPI